MAHKEAQERSNDPVECTWCFFDLDGTLIRKDSYLPFLGAWLRRHPRRWFSACRLPFVTLYWLVARKGRRYIKEAFLTNVMGGARRSEIEAFVGAFWDRFLPRYENQAVLERLRWHREQGHRIYLATASFDFYTEHLATVWPVDGVIATRAAWNGDVLTGRVAGANCRGEAKVKRIEEVLGMSLARTPCYAYSDSAADTPLLTAAAHAFFVRPSGMSPWTP